MQLEWMVSLDAEQTDLGFHLVGKGPTPDAALAALRAQVESVRDRELERSQNTVQAAALVLATEALRAGAA